MAIALLVYAGLIGSTLYVSDAVENRIVLTIPCISPSRLRPAAAASARAVRGDTIAALCVGGKRSAAA